MRPRSLCRRALIGACVSPQVELTGSSVFDYIHPADHVEMAERLGIRPHLRAEAGCHVAPESASSSASASSLAGTPEPGAVSIQDHSRHTSVVKVTEKSFGRPDSYFSPVLFFRSSSIQPSFSRRRAS